jgi:dihydropteroate synthase
MKSPFSSWILDEAVVTATPEDKFEYQFGQRKYTLSARTHVMGILNVTPDSFSDGGRYSEKENAIRRALEMIEEGADFIDIGGESTRPRGKTYGKGAVEVSAQDEAARVLPVIEALVRRTDIPISIDTYKAEVARRALQAGAVIVNDISGFTFDPEMPSVVAAAGASAVVMHIKGTPATMQLDPRYDDLFGEVTAALKSSLALGALHRVGQMIVDPGIGFGKNQKDNLRLIQGLSTLKRLNVPILIGPSRKSFIGDLLHLPVEDRLEGSLAAVTACILNGAHIVRVHDVRATKRTAVVADAIKRSTA